MTFRIPFFPAMVSVTMALVVVLFTACAKPPSSPEAGTHRIPQVYSLDTQIERLNALKAAGKSINIVIGRTNEETSHPALVDTATTQWIYGNIDPTSRYEDSDPIQLTMDFTDVPSLLKLQNGTFTNIIVDGSTWKFLVHDIEAIGPQYFRLLQTGGRFFFEASLGGHVLDRKTTNNAYFYKSNPNAVTGFSIPLNAILSQQAKKQALDKARVETTLRYQIFFPGVLGFIALNYHDTAIGGAPYPIVNGSWPVKEYYEAVK